MFCVELLPVDTTSRVEYQHGYNQVLTIDALKAKKIVSLIKIKTPASK